MASYVTPQKNAGYIFYVGLSSQADSRVLKVNPTLAFGDAKVSIDGGAFNNLGTTPAVTPAGGASVKVTLSAAEMNGDNIVVLLSDAAGGEWCDLVCNIQTSVSQIDSLALAATALTNATWTDVKAGYIDVSVASRNAVAPDNASVTAIKAKTDNLPSDPASDTTVNTRLAGSAYIGPPTVAQVVDGVWDELTSGHVIAGSTGAALTSTTDPLATQVPGSYASGTAGSIIGRLSAVPVQLVNPLGERNVLNLVAGDDYLAVDGRALIFSAVWWPVVTGATIAFKALTRKGIVLVSATGTVTGERTVQIELTAANTTAIGTTAETYTVVATLVSGHVVTLERSFVNTNIAVQSAT